MCRVMAVAVVYGLAEWVQVEHIQECYKSRLCRAGGEGADVRVRGLFHSKTLDSITIGFPFGLVTLFTFFLIGPNSPHCIWYNQVPAGFLLPVQLLLVGSFAQSCASIALGALEIHYRVNQRIADEVEGSLTKTCAHLACHGAEACFNITRLVLLCIFLLPILPDKALLGVRVGAFLLCVPVAVEWLLNACILYFACKGNNGIRRLRNILCVAFAALTVDPAAFLGETMYKEEARKASKGFLALKVFVLTLTMYLMWWVKERDQHFHRNCQAVGGQTLWSNFLNHQGSLVCWCVGSSLVYSILFCYFHCRGDREHDGQGADQSLPDHAPTQNRNYIPLLEVDDLTSAPQRSLEVKYAAALTGDLSGFILALGGVFASSMVPSRKDFAIINKLGEGTHGVAVKAKLRSTGDDYCLKLVSTRSYEQELRMLQLVTTLPHVFIVSLFRAFKVDPETTFKQTDGMVVKHGRCSDFSFALMITYVSGGDLQDYIKEEKWKMEGVSRASKMRTFAAEIAEILRFLHAEHGIIYRDLKPDNVLIRPPSSRRKQSHICLTDLGWAKRPTEANPAASHPAGNPLTAAPEVVEGEGPYDKSVDAFSWAVNYLLIQGLPQKEASPLKSAAIDLDRVFSTLCPAMPKQARPLLRRCLASASDRPTMEEIVNDKFFKQSVEHNGETYPCINMHDLLEDAARGE
jgi:hypothetical protein